MKNNNCIFFLISMVVFCLHSCCPKSECLCDKADIELNIINKPTEDWIIQKTDKNYNTLGSHTFFFPVNNGGGSYSIQLSSIFDFPNDPNYLKSYNYIIQNAKLKSVDTLSNLDYEVVPTTFECVKCFPVGSRMQKCDNINYKGLFRNRVFVNSFKVTL